MNLNIKPLAAKAAALPVFEANPTVTILYVTSNLHVFTSFENANFAASKLPDKTVTSITQAEISTADIFEIEGRTAAQEEPAGIEAEAARLFFENPKVNCYYFANGKAFIYPNEAKQALQGHKDKTVTEVYRPGVSTEDIDFHKMMLANTTVNGQPVND